MKLQNRFLRQCRTTLAIIGAGTVLLSAAGCGSREAAVTAPKTTPQQSVATDQRIPPARRAQIEQTMAQQQAAHAPGTHP
ncbi:MAG: hypothetical protein ABIY70_26430 [Capsulimonas sp.]|uniref:hypothetical protein n=1 Tax=Capsulimonas sp. TaxID=2494211 RepID=UPI003266A813